MQSMHNATKTVIHASIWIFMSSLKQPIVASFPLVSLGDGRRWTIRNSTSNCSVSMNGATLRHEWGFVLLLVHSEASLKIQVNSPIRLGLKMQHGDKQTWPKNEAVPQIPFRRTACIGTVRKKSQRLKKFVYLMKSLGVLSLAVPTSLFSGNGTFNVRTVTYNLIMVLA